MPDKIQYHKQSSIPVRSRDDCEDRKEATKWYSQSAWRKQLRPAFLAENPLCARCGYPANEVHHKIDRRERPDLAWDWANLESLCKPCHSRETATRQSKGKRS